MVCDVAEELPPDPAADPLWGNAELIALGLADD